MFHVSLLFPIRDTTFITTSITFLSPHIALFCVFHVLCAHCPFLFRLDHSSLLKFHHPFFFIAPSVPFRFSDTCADKRHVHIYTHVHTHTHSVLNILFYIKCPGFKVKVLRENGRYCHFSLCFQIFSAWIHNSIYDTYFGMVKGTFHFLTRREKAAKLACRRCWWGWS